MSRYNQIISDEIDTKLMRRDGADRRFLALNRTNIRGKIGVLVSGGLLML